MGEAGAGGCPPGPAGRCPVTPLGAGEAEVPLPGTCEGGRARRPPAPRAAGRRCSPHRPLGAVGRAALLRRPPWASPKRNEKYRLRAGRGCAQRVLLPSLRCWNVGSALELFPAQVLRSRRAQRCAPLPREAARVRGRSAAPGEAPWTASRWAAWVCLTAVLKGKLLQQAKKPGTQKSLSAGGQWETGGIHRHRLGDQHFELCVAS